MKTPKLSILIFLFTLFSFSSFSQSEAIKKIESTIQMIDNAYMDSVDYNKLAEAAIRSMLKELNRHCGYIPKDKTKDMFESYNGTYEGIGINFKITNDTIMITNTNAGGPSEMVGLMLGDKIISIDGENVAGTGITNSIVVKKLRGSKGTNVMVEILRRNMDKLIEFRITRDKISIYSVVAYHMVSKDIGYIKINQFSEETVNDFKTAMTKLKDDGMKNLILDLSNNNGGIFRGATELADEFLSEKKKIVYTEGKSSPKSETYATNLGSFEKGKLVIMINESTASASEIFAGSIQDWDRGLIIGRTSFGKGLVNRHYIISDGSAVRLTNARYYLPSGRCIQKPFSDFKVDSNQYYTNAKRTVIGSAGIIPDVIVPKDTTMTTEYYLKLNRQGIFNTYSLNYVADNKNRLNVDYPNIANYKTAFIISKSLMKDFIYYADNNGVHFNKKQFKTSEKLIRIRLKAQIARNLWNMDAYYQIINSVNPIFLKAVEVMNDDTFKNNKIASH